MGLKVAGQYQRIVITGTLRPEQPRTYIPDIPQSSDDGLRRGRGVPLKPMKEVPHACSARERRRWEDSHVGT